MKLSECDRAVVAAARAGRRAALLLASVEAVGKSVVGGHMKHLSGRLVVPGAPGLSSVDGKSRALVDAEKDDVGIVRMDPDPVVVVASRSSFDRRKVFSA